MSDPQNPTVPDLDLSDLRPSGFFVFRTPLLPFEEVEAWSADLAAPSAFEGAPEPDPDAGDDDPDPLEEALAADRERLRERLRRIIERPEVREALFVASPELRSGIEAWRRKPESKKGQRAEQALVRYFVRMASRATPFGLFSGCSLGEVGASSRMELAARSDYRRHTRLDMDYLFALTEELGQRHEVRRELRYRPNSSLYHAAGRLRYAESRLAGRFRSHHLVGVDATDYLDATLERARDGATVVDLTRGLVADLADDPDGGVSEEEAEEFVHELIDSQLLVSELTPAVTGPEPIHGLIEQMSERASLRPAAARLGEVRDALAALDAGGPGADPERYREVARDLRELPTEVELPRLFQVDMTKPVGAGATLGGGVIEEIERGIRLLHLLAGRQRNEALVRFRRAFSERYEDSRPVPLVEVLDEEVGIGFERTEGAGAEAAPLLEGLDFRPPPGEGSVPWGPAQGLLLRKLEGALADGASEIEIAETELAGLEGHAPGELPPLPDAFQVMAELAAASPEAVESGDFELHLKGAYGPSGARLLGRFCHADGELRRCVEEHLRDEEAHRPDAVFAEVVHLPEGRIGNILSRPVLRDHEIPFLGRGGAPEEHRIPVSDLWVTVRGPEIVLFSERLGRRVLPRLTSAHNFTNRSLGVYRFLCSLQSQSVRPGVTWGWGPLDACTFLPRVRSGRLILSRARWRITGEELRTIDKKSGAARYRALQGWRERRRLPRWVVLVDGDNELLVDLDNPLAIDSFLSVAARRRELLLSELFPAPDQLWTRGPEGRFVHEIVVPYVRRPPERRAEAPSPEAPSPGSPSSADDPGVPAKLLAGDRVRRIFPPGSEWLYAKLYTGTATADRVLAEVVAPVRRRALDSGAADGWFFIRYGDPDWHLRVRFHGPPERLHGEVLPLLQRAAAPLLDDGRVHRFQLDSYEREVERYGGPEGIDLAERIAWVDSEAVLEIVELLEGDEGSVARWQLTLRGIDLLLRDLGFEGDEKLQILERIQTSYARELRADARLRKQLADRLRRDREELETLVAPEWSEEHPLSPGFAALDRRSERLRPIIAELHRRQEAGRLDRTIGELTPSYAHMFANRLLRSDGRIQEMVIYDFLHRVHLSLAARARAMAKKKAKKR